MMKVEILEDVRHGRELFVKGDRRTVDDDVGTYFCALGWAKDIDGAVETGLRNTAEVVLTPDSVSHKLQDTGA